MSNAIHNSLIDIFDRLHARFGDQHWWPQTDGAFEIIIGAILTQNTAWTNVEKAITNLKHAQMLSPHALHRVTEKQLAALIRPSGYFNLKAKKLLAFAKFLIDEHHGKLTHLFDQDTMQLRDELLGVYGIGPETADSIMLYAAQKPIFVADAYTRRIFARLGFAREDVTYAEMQKFFMDNLPRDEKLFNEYHALIVALGKDICKKSKPKCETCPLVNVCEMGKIIERG